MEELQVPPLVAHNSHLKELGDRASGSNWPGQRVTGGTERAALAKLGEGQLLVSFLRPPDHVGMPWRWLIEHQSERARGVHHPPCHIPSAMKVAPRGKSVLTTVFPDLRFGQTVHPEDRQLQGAPARRSGHEGMVLEPEPAIGP